MQTLAPPLQNQSSNQSILEVSLVLRSRVLHTLDRVAIVTLLRTLLISAHEPPSSAFRTAAVLGWDWIHYLCSECDVLIRHKDCSQTLSGLEGLGSEVLQVQETCLRAASYPPKRPACSSRPLTLNWFAAAEEDEDAATRSCCALFAPGLILGLRI